jgi:hypothetical protein
MNKVDEVLKLKFLLDKGEITENEFQFRKNELMSDSIKDASGEIDTHNSLQSNGKENISNIKHENVIYAGKSIKSSVFFQVLSYISNVIGLILLLFSCFDILQGIINGSEQTLEDSPRFIIACVVLIIGFIFWILSLTEMSKAGNFLEQYSESKLLSKSRNLSTIKHLSATIAIASLLLLLVIIFHLVFSTSFDFGFIVWICLLIIFCFIIFGDILVFKNKRWTFFIGIIVYLISCYLLVLTLLLLRIPFTIISIVAVVLLVRFFTSIRKIY